MNVAAERLLAVKLINELRLAWGLPALGNHYIPKRTRPEQRAAINRVMAEAAVRDIKTVRRAFQRVRIMGGTK